MKLILILGQRMKVALTEDDHLIYYEEKEKQETYLSILYLRLKQLPIQDIVVITQGFLSNKNLNDAMVAFTVTCKKEEYFCYIKEEELEEIQSFANNWGIQARFFDKLGFQLSLVEGAVILIDKIGSAYSIVLKDEVGIQGIQYVSEEYLLQAMNKYQSQAELVIDTQAVFHKSYTDKYLNLEDVDPTFLLPIKTTLTMLGYTEEEESTKYEISFAKQGKDWKINGKWKKNISHFLSIQILIVTVVIAIAFSINQYLSKDIVAIEFNNAKLEMKVEEETQKLKHKEVYKETLSNRVYAEMVTKLYKMKLHGYLGKIEFYENNMKVLLYLKDSKELSDTKKKLDAIAKVTKIIDLGRIKTEKQTLRKYEISLTMKNKTQGKAI